MLSNVRDVVIVLVVVAVVASGGGVALTGESPRDGQEADESSVVASCATTPPDDLSDPERDVTGWEDGYWYTESIDVNQSDGVQAAEQEALVARTTARVEAIRCVEFEESVPVSVVSRQEFGRRQAERSVPDDLRTFDNAKFEALFLVGEANDSIAVQNENAAGGILGYYSPRQDRIVVVTERTESPRIDELTLAHELIHAWQDQQFDITDDRFSARFRDDANAVAGIIEGDANYVESLYERQCGQGWDCLETEDPSSDGLANLGVYVVKFHPYSDGPAFVQMARDVGGWRAVNRLYQHPPESSEQIIHPQRYRSDSPTTVKLDDTATEAWERVRPSGRPDYASVGESALSAMFVYPYYDSEGETEIVPVDQWLNYDESGNVSSLDPLDYESQYSTGWDGDRLHVYRNDDELAYVWKLVWDSPQDAQQFRDGYERVLDYWGAEQVGANTWRIEQGGFADAFYVQVTDRTVTIVNAPTVDGLSEVRPGIDPSGGEATGNETVW